MVPVGRKALVALGLRGENKDAYDLFYIVRNYGYGIDDVEAWLRPFRNHDAATRVIAILPRDFLSHNDIGPPACRGAHGELDR
jgi:hypothetical protein